MIRTAAASDRAVAGRRSVGAAVVVAIALLGLLLAIMSQIGVPPLYGAAVLISVFVLASLIAGLKAGTGYVADWLFGANRATAAVIGMVMAAGVLSGPLMISITGLFMSEKNALGPLLLVGPMLGLTLFTLILAPYLRNSGAVSPASLVGIRFVSAAVRLPATIAVGLLCILLLWAQFRAGILLARLYFDLGETVSAAGLAILVAAMLLPGGQYGVIRSNLVFYAIIAVAFLLPLVWLSILGATVPVPQLAAGIAAMSEIDALEMQLRQLDVPIFTDGIATGWPLLSHGLSIVVPLLVLSAGFFTFPTILGATQASRNAHSARKSGLLALAYVALVITAAPAAAAFATLGIYENIMGLPVVDVPAQAGWAIEWSGVNSLFSTGSPLVRLCGYSIRSVQELIAACGGNPDHLIGPDDFEINGELPAYAIAQMTSLPDVVSMFTAAGLFAAVLSTANSAAFMTAVTIGDGLRECASGRHPPASLRLFILRATGTVVLFAAAALAVNTDTSPVDLTLWAIAVAASLAPVLAATVWSERLGLIAVICGIAVPLLVLLLFGLSEFLDPDTALYQFAAAIGTHSRMPLPFQAGFAGFVTAALILLALAFAPAKPRTGDALDRIRMPGKDTSPDHLQ